MRALISLAVYAALLAAATGQSAHSQQIFAFSEWEGMSPQARAAYVAGSIDAMLGMRPENPTSAGERFQKAFYDRHQLCFAKTRITTGQIADGLVALAARRPSVRSSPIYGAILAYASELCPELLGDQAITQLFEQTFGKGN